MFRSLLSTLVILLSINGLCNESYGLTPLESADYYPAIAKRFAKYMPLEHLSHEDIDDNISSRTWTNYVQSLDYERVYFLQSDIDQFAKERLDLDNEIKVGDLDFAYKVYNVFRTRVENRCNYVNDLLEKGFDLNKDETYAWKRKGLPWPKDEAEWNDLWRKKIKNEYESLFISDELKKNHSATNKLPATASADTNTNKVTKIKPLTNKESIEKRYNQLKTVIIDNDSESVFQKYLSSFANAYDPHSDYWSPSSAEDFDIEMKLSLVGIGALLQSEDGAAKIVRVIPGGPADKDKRLKAGDKIIAVAQGDNEPEDILHLPLYKIVKKIRGKKGSKVILTVIPASDPSGLNTEEVDLIRGEVKLEEQAATNSVYTVQGADGEQRKLGVITLPAFYADMNAQSIFNSANNAKSSSADVEKIITKLKDQDHVDGIILDLRSNGGGSLLEAILIAGKFIASGPTVQVQGRFGAKPLYDNNPSISYSGPLIVLVNRLSASASEIVAAALQDYGRAVIVGDTKTHGKGTVQSIMKLGSDNRMGSIKITTSAYYRITGESTQLKGVIPDIILHSPYDYMELGEEFLSNPLKYSASTRARFTPVANLKQLIDVLKEKSETRRSKDKYFKIYTDLLKRIKVINERKEIPLNYLKRKNLAQSEDELRELQDKLIPSEFEEKDKASKSDIVLTETLNILSDYVIIQKAHPEMITKPEPPPKSFLNSLYDYIRAL